VRRIRGFAVAAVVALVCASAAFAQDPYNSDAGDVQGQIGGGASGSDGGGGALPFTGLDLFLLVGAGAVLLTGGLVLRRLAKAKS
jgi:opacity protein-like surface antigen